MTEELMIFNGINGATGNYDLPPQSPKDIASVARGTPISDDHKTDIAIRRDLDASSADHFGLRDRLTAYYKFMKYKLGDSPSKHVTIGRDGWLFLGSIQQGYSAHYDPIGDYRNVNLYSQEELQRFAQRMTALKSWLNKKGIEYVFVIAPCIDMGDLQLETFSMRSG